MKPIVPIESEKCLRIGTNLLGFVKKPLRQRNCSASCFFSSIFGH